MAEEKKEIRHIFHDPEKGWYEKKRDGQRITKYYKTQQEAIDAAKVHIKNSSVVGGSVIIQGKKGSIRANEKVAPKKK